MTAEVQNSFLRKLMDSIDNKIMLLELGTSDNFISNDINCSPKENLHIFLYLHF